MANWTKKGFLFAVSLAAAGALSGCVKDASLAQIMENRNDRNGPFVYCQHTGKDCAFFGTVAEAEKRCEWRQTYTFGSVYVCK